MARLPWKLRIPPWALMWALALISQIWLTDSFYGLSGNDKNRQILAARNWQNGHGLALQTAEIEDLSQTVYQDMTGWPPGYSWLLTLAQRVTGDWFEADYYLTLIGQVLIFVALGTFWWMLGDDTDRRSPFWFFLFSALTLTPYQIITSSGIWALGLFLMAIFFLMRVHRSKEVANTDLVLAMALLLGASMIRYAFFPFLLLPGLTYLFMAWQINRDRFLQAGMLGISTAALVILGLIWRLRPTTGEGANTKILAQSSEDLQWANLLQYDAFPLKAWINVSADRFVAFFDLQGQGASLVVNLMFLLACAGILYLLFLQIPEAVERRRAGRDYWQILDIGYIIGLIASLLLIGMLTLLSLRIPPEIGADGQPWTYVGETRYYAPVLLFIQLTVFVRIFQHDLGPIQKGVLRGLATLGIIAAGAVYLGHIAEVLEKPADKALSFDQMLREVYSQVNSRPEEGPGLLVIYGSNAYARDVGFVSALAGANIIEASQLKGKAICSSEPLEVWVACPKENVEQIVALYDLDLMPHEARPILGCDKAHIFRFSLSELD